MRDVTHGVLSSPLKGEGFIAVRKKTAAPPAFPGEQRSVAKLRRPGITWVDICARCRTDVIPDSRDVSLTLHAASGKACGEGGVRQS